MSSYQKQTLFHDIHVSFKMYDLLGKGECEHSSQNLQKICHKSSFS
jgi:hypothetical protein